MKTPLILLHGALGSASQMEVLAASLPDSWLVYHFNFPGHGGLPANRDFSIPYFAETVLAYLVGEEIHYADFFGFSMGGYVALYLAWKFPSCVGRVVTLGTKFDWTPESAARESAMLDPEKLEAKVPHFARILETRHAPEDWKQVVRKTSVLMTGLGNQPVLGEEALRSITCPVTIFLGEQDHMVTKEESAAAAATLTNGHLEIIPGARHPIEQVEPELLAKHLKEIISPV
jgi:pimeloyl-ACP methyl ester carboxylesterase